MRKPHTWTALALMLALALGSALALRAVALPPAAFLPLAQRSAGAVPLPPPDAASARLTVPAGFAVRLYAAGLSIPRLMTVGPDGALYVAEMGAGRVVRLADADNDGRADAAQAVATGLNTPHSVEWHNGTLYVAETGRVSRLTDGNGDGDFLDSGERQDVTTNIPGSGGHASRTAHIGPDGKLYVAAGSTSNITPETDRRRATIMRFNLDGSIPADNPFANDPVESRRPVWAEGLRNSVDFLFMPNGELWADHNGSDGLGNDAPPEEIVINVEKGRHYGWPYCYTPTLGVTPAGTKEVRDTRVSLAPPVASCDDVVPALFTDPAHSAPLGMARYGASAFPAAYRGGLFVAYHGSWNAALTPRDCKVQFVQVANNRPVGSQPFLTGFRDSEMQPCGSAWGRPAGVAIGAHGELFVSDDKNGNIYRVVYVGQ